MMAGKCGCGATAKPAAKPEKKEEKSTKKSSLKRKRERELGSDSSLSYSKNKSKFINDITESRPIGLKSG